MAGAGVSNEIVKQFLNVRKHSIKYAPAFLRLHGLLNGGNGRSSYSQLRKDYGKRLKIKMMLGEKSDLGMCQLADTVADRLKLNSDYGVTVQPAKSPGVYYGYLASHKNRFAVPSELKYTDSVYSSRSIYLCLWTDLQQEAPDLFYQVAVGNIESCNVYSFGHVHNPRAKIRSIGGISEFNSWLEGRCNIFPKNLNTAGANVYVFFSDNFLEMFPTTYRHVLGKIKELLDPEAFIRFAYVSRYPITNNALTSYSFPPISTILSERTPNSSYNVNVLCNVQRQEYSENNSTSKFSVRMLAHSSLIRADQPMNDIVVAQKTPAEDNANMAYLDKFLDYKTATNPIFVYEFTNRLQLMHPHMLFLYLCVLIQWPSTLSTKLLPLAKNLELSEVQKTSLLKKTQTKVLSDLMLDFDNDKLRNSIIRALAYGTPEFIEDLRTQLLEYTSIPGTAFNINKAKALLNYITNFPEYIPDREFYEFSQAKAETPYTAGQLVAAPTSIAPARTPRSTDSFWKIDCEFVRHAISLRGHIYEVNNKLKDSWCKLAPESI